MNYLQPNTTLQGGKYRRVVEHKRKKLRLSERHKNLFLDVRAGADYPIERVLGQGVFGNKHVASCTSNGKMDTIKELVMAPLRKMVLHIM